MTNSFESHISSISYKYIRHCIHKGLFLPAYKVKVRITTRCNLRCIKCDTWKKAKRELDPVRFYRLVDELSYLGTSTIKLTGGEVTLHENLCNMVKYIKLKGMTATITTNGTNLDYGLALKLVRSGIDQVNVSIDSHSAQIHDKIVGFLGAWKASVKALKHLGMMRRTKKEDITLIVQTVLTRLNYKELPRMIMFAEQLEADSLSILPFCSNGVDTSELKLTKKDALNLAENILPEAIDEADQCNVDLKLMFIGDPSFGESTRVQFSLYNGMPCLKSWFDLVVDVSGRVFICCTCEKQGWSMGNIMGRTLHSIISNTPFMEFRLLSKPPVQNKCSQYCISELVENMKYWNSFKKIFGWERFIDL